ncbi:MAG TPA: hypothetical protein VM841_08355, partial [Actinomycetota bacterium]|nr:hypothetical protein [Actinomycetota bacterium]
MRRLLTIAALVLVIAVVHAVRTHAQGNTGCDRACLEGFVDRYLDALVARDPARLPLAANVRFTENGVRLNVGDAQWKTVIGKGSYRLFVTDPEAGQVTFIGTVVEEARTPGGSPTAIALRLKVENRQIAEIETLMIRSTAAQNTGRGAGGAPASAFTGAAVN